MYIRKVSVDKVTILAGVLSHFVDASLAENKLPFNLAYFLGLLRNVFLSLSHFVNDWYQKNATDETAKMLHSVLHSVDVVLREGK